MVSMSWVNTTTVRNVVVTNCGKIGNSVVNSHKTVLDGPSRRVPVGVRRRDQPTDDPWTNGRRPFNRINSS